MYFLIKDDKWLEKYDKIWDKVCNSIKKRIHSEPFYDEKYLKTKIKFCDGKTSRSFHHNGIPKEGFHCFCLSGILIDCVFKIGKNYYTQVFVKEFKYIVKKKRGN